MRWSETKSGWRAVETVQSANACHVSMWTWVQLPNTHITKLLVVHACNPRAGDAEIIGSLGFAG